MPVMTADESSSIRTRPSLLDRLKDDDAEGWREFYRTYGKLVRDFALRAGLNDTEADEVVQETAIAIARHLPAYRYDPQVCRFKTWLLNQTAWRVKDQFRKRAKAEHASAGRRADDTTRTATIERVADPAAASLEALFDVEWRRNLLATALERVKTRFSLKQIQMFDLNVREEWPAAEVAHALGVSVANVYVTKHRIAAALKREMARLEREWEPGDDSTR
jgi:RNA polymerase sigma factor (sigma-70 family)